jgi:hypothetical protein
MAKIYRFIFSALLICASFAGKGQTVDGKLYTIFNNWYQWSGGKFNTNLNIPKVTATTGRDTGGIRYALADSSVYVWTGSQWRQVGGATITASNGLTKTGNNIKLGGTLTENTTIDAKNYDITFDTVNNFNVRTKDYVPNITAIEGGGASMVDAYYRNQSNMGYSGIDVLGDSANSQNFVKISAIKNTTRTTFLTAYADSLEIDQKFGVISIKNLDSTADTTTHKPIVYDPTSKRMKYKTAWPNTDTATVVKAYVTNAEAVTITKGQVVYIFGAQGDRASVKLAKNTSDTFSSKTLGIVRADIAAGAAGWITTQGQVSGINLGAYSPGDVLWLDSVPGGFTATKPQAPYHAVFVGVVERANAGNGLIYVKPQNGVELDELHDVRITSLANNEIIRYNSSLGYWENKTVESILQFDTVPLAVFGAGSGAAGDTAAFSTSALYGSFYNAGSDTLIITQMRAGVLGTSPSITTEVYWNDSLNITTGATILVSGGTSVTGTIGATNVTSFTNNKIPPNVWVFVRTSAVATKPTYFTLTLLGYKKRI